MLDDVYVEIFKSSNEFELFVNSDTANTRAFRIHNIAMP